MTPKTFIFFGRSGSGKGTQAQLLIKYLQEKDASNKVVYIETGSKLREFSHEVGLSAQLTAKVMADGGLLPSFLPIWIWTHFFVRNLNGTEHMILDGLSRRAYEAPILDDALKFYKREKPFVVCINVSRDWAKEHLLKRDRSDDNKRSIDERLDWYDSNVLPTIEYFKKSDYYQMIDINGEQSIEDVHKEMLERLGL